MLNCRNDRTCIDTNAERMPIAEYVNALDVTKHPQSIMMNQSILKIYVIFLFLPSFQIHFKFISNELAPIFICHLTQLVENSFHISEFLARILCWPDQMPINLCYVKFKCVLF